MREDINKLSQIMGFKVPLDGFMMSIVGKPVIDIVKLDKRLMSVYNYEGSMEDFIKQKFGNEALEIINNNIESLSHEQNNN